MINIRFIFSDIKNLPIIPKSLKKEDIKVLSNSFYS